jgi:hypothetical protein
VFPLAETPENLTGVERSKTVYLARHFFLKKKILYKLITLSASYRFLKLPKHCLEQMIGKWKCWANVIQSMFVLAIHAASSLIIDEFFFFTIE